MQGGQSYLAIPFSKGSPDHYIQATWSFEYISCRIFSSRLCLFRQEAGFKNKRPLTALFPFSWANSKNSLAETKKTFILLSILFFRKKSDRQSNGYLHILPISVCLTVCLSIYMSVNRSVYQTHPSICQFLHPSFHLFSICQSVCLVSLSVCLSL